MTADPVYWMIRVYIRGDHGIAYGIEPLASFGDRDKAERDGWAYAAEHATRLGAPIGVMTLKIAGPYPAWCEVIAGPIGSGR